MNAKSSALGVCSLTEPLGVHHENSCPEIAILNHNLISTYLHTPTVVGGQDSRRLGLRRMLAPQAPRYPGIMPRHRRRPLTTTLFVALSHTHFHFRQTRGKYGNRISWSPVRSLIAAAQTNRNPTYPTYTRQGKANEKHVVNQLALREKQRRLRDSCQASAAQCYLRMLL